MNSTKLAHLLHQAESQGKGLQVITTSGDRFDVHPNRGLHTGKKVRTLDSGMIPLNTIQGYVFTEQSDRSDSTSAVKTGWSNPSSANVLMGGFTTTPLPKTDKSRQDAHRNNLRKAIEDPEYRQQHKQQRIDSATSTARAKVATLPSVTLTEDQKQRVRQMIQDGNGIKEIRSTFGRVDSADLKAICDDLQISSIDRIFRGLT